MKLTEKMNEMLKEAASTMSVEMSDCINAIDMIAQYVGKRYRIEADTMDVHDGKYGSDVDIMVNTICLPSQYLNALLTAAIKAVSEKNEGIFVPVWNSVVNRRLVPVWNSAIN